MGRFASTPVVACSFSSSSERGRRERARGKNEKILSESGRRKKRTKATLRKKKKGSVKCRPMRGKTRM